MIATKSREIIYGNMDVMSVSYDALDNLVECKRNISICINRVTKIINKGKERNEKLEVNCRQRVA